MVKRLSLILIINVMAVLFIASQCSPEQIPLALEQEASRLDEMNGDDAERTIQVVITPTVTPMEESVPMPQDLVPIPNGLEPLVQKAKDDLAQRLAIKESEMGVVEITEMVWPDASLGCPQPGMMYAQVLQDGLLIKLKANDQIYEYHSGGTRDPFLCEKLIIPSTKNKPNLELVVPPPADSQED